MTQRTFGVGPTPSLWDSLRSSQQLEVRPIGRDAAPSPEQLQADLERARAMQQELTEMMDRNLRSVAEASLLEVRPIGRDPAVRSENGPQLPALPSLGAVPAVRSAPTLEALRPAGGLTAGRIQHHLQSGASGLPLQTNATATVRDAFSRLSGDELSRWVETNTTFKRGDTIGTRNADAIARAVMSEPRVSELGYDALDQAGVALTEGHLAAGEGAKWAESTKADRDGAVVRQREAMTAARANRRVASPVLPNAAAARASAPPTEAQLAQVRGALESVLDRKQSEWASSGSYRTAQLDTFIVDGQELKMSFDNYTKLMKFEAPGMQLSLAPHSPGYAQLSSLRTQLLQRSELSESDPAHLRPKQGIIYN